MAARLAVHELPYGNHEASDTLYVANHSKPVFSTPKQKTSKDSSSTNSKESKIRLAGNKQEETLEHNIVLASNDATQLTLSRTSSRVLTPIQLLAQPCPATMEAHLQWRSACWRRSQDQWPIGARLVHVHPHLRVADSPLRSAANPKWDPFSWLLSWVETHHTTWI